MESYKTKCKAYQKIFKNNNKEFMCENLFNCESVKFFKINF